MMSDGGSELGSGERHLHRADSHEIGDQAGRDGERDADEPRADGSDERPSHEGRARVCQIF